jgi:TnpA family transposase
LVSDTYIALFSRFIACGSYEGHSILDFVAENRSVLQPIRCTPTHMARARPSSASRTSSESSSCLAFANWQDLNLFRPDQGARYEHIDELFTGSIDWELIKAHRPDMLRVALSIKAGRLLPSAILRRLGTYSRKNRLYFAFRELGRVIRTDFLLRYLGSIELRRQINAATNKSEHFSRYTQWVLSEAAASRPQPSETSSAR